MTLTLTAQEKVAARYPKSKLKNVLYWLASAADHEDGSGCWISLETLADRASVSVRTAQRHLRALEALGDIKTLFMASGHRSNLYSIPICMDVSKHQQKLNLAQRDHSASKIPVTPVDNFDKIVTLPGGLVLKTRLQNCHPTHKDLIILKGSEGRVTNLSVADQHSKAFKGESDENSDPDALQPISPETERELQELMAVLSARSAVPRSGRKTTLTPSGEIFEAPAQS